MEILKYYKDASKKLSDKLTSLSIDLDRDSIREMYNQKKHKKGHSIKIKRSGRVICCELLAVNTRLNTILIHNTKTNKVYFSLYKDIELI